MFLFFFVLIFVFGWRVFLDGVIQLRLCNVSGGSIAFLFLSFFNCSFSSAFFNETNEFPLFICVFVSLFEQVMVVHCAAVKAWMEITSQYNTQC